MKIHFLTALLAPLALWGCTTQTETLNVDFVRNYFSPETFEPSPRFSSLFAEPRPVLDLEFIDLGVTGKLILEQKDGPFSRYLSADLGTIVLQNGLLHSLYGFGEPLAGSDLSEPLSLVLAARSGTADRFHTYVDGEDRATSRTFRCEIAFRSQDDVAYPTQTVKTTVMSETCQSLDQSFENLYWVDQSRGEVIQSRQWVGPNVGSVVTRVTHP
jgi:hypothetical protein